MLEEIQVEKFQVLEEVRVEKFQVLEEIDVEKFQVLEESTVTTFLSNLYVDDKINGCRSIDEEFDFYLLVKTLMFEANFRLRIRISNLNELFKRINEIKNEIFDANVVAANEIHKVLGVVWSFKNEMLL